MKNRLFKTCLTGLALSLTSLAHADNYQILDDQISNHAAISGAALTITAGSTIEGDLAAAAAVGIGANSGSTDDDGPNIHAGAAAVIGINSFVHNISTGAALTLGAHARATSALVNYGSELPTLGVNATAPPPPPRNGDVPTIDSSFEDWSLLVQQRLVEVKQELYALTPGDPGNSREQSFELPTTMGIQAFNPGVYRGTALTIAAYSTIRFTNPDNVPHPVWIFNLSGAMTTGAGTIFDAPSTGPANVIWNIGGALNLGAKTKFSGIALVAAAVSGGTSSVTCGNLYAKAAISIGSINEGGECPLMTSKAIGLSVNDDRLLFNNTEVNYRGRLDVLAAVAELNKKSATAEGAALKALSEASDAKDVADAAVFMAVAAANAANAAAKIAEDLPFDHSDAADALHEVRDAATLAKEAQGKAIVAANSASSASAYAYAAAALASKAAEAAWEASSLYVDLFKSYDLHTEAEAAKAAAKDAATAYDNAMASAAKAGSAIVRCDAVIQRHGQETQAKAEADILAAQAQAEAESLAAQAQAEAERLASLSIIYKIGETGPNGGIVYYITDGGKHGLEATRDAGRTSAKWGCSGSVIPGANGTAVGTGKQNTANIIAGCTEPTAARAASAWGLGWYLPSKDEVNLLYDAIDYGIMGPDWIGKLVWSSSQSCGRLVCGDTGGQRPSDWAMCHRIGESYEQYQCKKSQVLAVVPVRDF
jgi:hypothetical protein